MDGFGPETVTIMNLDYNSIYTYYVHNFSGDGALENSDASITVYTSTNPEGVKYFVPQGEGIYWKVFEIRYGRVIPCETNCIQDVLSEELLQKRGNYESSLFSNLPSKK